MIMQEQIENTYKLNAVPSTTWTWLKMNNDIVTIDANFDLGFNTNPKNGRVKGLNEVSLDRTYFVQGAVTEVPKGFAVSTINKDSISNEIPSFENSGVFNISSPKAKDNKNAWAKDSASEDFSNSKNDAEKELQTKNKNHPLFNLLNEQTKEIQYITIEGKSEAPLIITFDDKSFDSKNCISSQIINAKKDSEGTVIFFYAGNANQSFIQTKVYAQENANVNIVKVQLFDKNTLHFDDTLFIEDENANVKFSQIELGAKHVDSGVHNVLRGYKSNFTSDVAYICQNAQVLDMNHIVIHKGKKTECKMNVNGTLKDEACKTYRGTIDLQKGCAGAKGNEMEETLLLSPKAVNKSLPIILCDEEDVEGEHGATLGRISSEILFYMQSRGISKEAAEAIMARAKVQAVADTIPSDSIKEKIYDYLDKI